MQKQSKSRKLQGKENFFNVQRSGARLRYLCGITTYYGTSIEDALKRAGSQHRRQEGIIEESPYPAEGKDLPYMKEPKH